MEPKTGLGGWKHIVVFLAGLLVGVVSAVEIVPKAQLATASGSGGGFVAADGSLDAGGSLDGTASGPGGGGGSKNTDTASTATGGSAPTEGTTTGSVGGGGSGGGGIPPSREGLECAPGKNGGATDRGVTGTEISLATTTVDSGPGAAFLRDVRYAMEAVTNKVNAAGGICGRKLVVEYRDDGWNAQTGAQYLRNFIQQGVFAIPVGPSSEGLRVVIDSGDIDNSQTAVVGADGLLIDQYQKPEGGAQPWVWPVATATVASARIMVQEAFKRGARNFSIVFDRNYRFGREGALAFNSEVRQVTGQNVNGFNESFTCDQSFCGIDAGKSSYSEAARFVPGDFVALFLDPITALAWMRDPNTPAASSIQYGYGAAQPLFTRGFAVNCKDKCDQMMVWTGFKPPIESYANEPAVKQYVSDLKRTKSDADEFNAFAQGGYIGMLLLVEALKKVGPDLTRERLKAALDRMSLNTGLTLQEGIRFSPSSRYANTTMQGFVIQHKGTFGGWRAGPKLSDPRPTAGIG